MELNKVDNHKKQLIEALEKYKGIVSTACKSVGLSRTTYYDYVNTDPEFAKAVDEAQEDAIDFVEGKLFEKINGIQMLGKGATGGDDDDEDPTYTLPPSDTAIIFYLKTKGKKRGYVEKTEVESKNINYNSVEMSKEDIKKISDALENDF